ncbi:MAG: acyloxyacyl hydrolase [Syntrophobacteraceae bacterium]|jgi:hypothetical protein
MSASVKLSAGMCFTLILLLFVTHAQAQLSQNAPASASGGLAVQQDNTEHLFTKCSWDTALSFGGAAGVQMLGTSLRHDFVLGTFDVGRIISDTQGAGHWYEGNWEVLGELFGGYQLNPGRATVVGLTPFIRYNFVTHSRWVPFVEAGAGVTYTDIGRPDQRTSFEFNLQPGIGLHYFMCRDLAVTLQSRVLHLSNAGIETPNLGVNTVAFLLGLTWFH